MSCFERTALLLGEATLSSLRQKRVALFGIGGVGSWCAEALVRSGVEQLTIIDGDVVSESNINRQVLALQSTVGRAKVEVLRERLLDINPAATITAIQRFFSMATAATFPLDGYDYVIDCIDSLSSKAFLLHYASSSAARVFSSMGAALKVDPSRIRVAEFWQVRGCPLGAMLRKKMRRHSMTIEQPIQCVFSDEVLDNKGTGAETANGSMVHVTAVFGFTLAGLVVQDVIREAEEREKTEG